MDIVKLLESFYSQMSNKEKQTTNQILNNLEPLAKCSVKDAAKIYKTSAATLVRLAKKIGLSGYSELSFQTKQFIKKKKNVFSIKKNKNNLLKITQSFSEAINDIATDENENNLEKLVNKIYESRSIYIIGFGYTGLVANYLKFMFLSFGKAINCFDDVTMIKHIERIIDTNDLVIIFSASGSKNEYSTIYKKCKEKNISISIVTMNANLKNLKDADYGFVLPTVSLVTNQMKVQAIDSQPVFWIFASCIIQLYKSHFPLKS